MKIHNFSAGPGILPAEVLQEAAAGALNLDGCGLSILEMSHRGPQFVAILDEAIALVKELLGLNDDYEVLFLTGGASTQFFMSAMNLINDNDKYCFINTGTWSTKAIKEAKIFGDIDVIASSEDKNFAYIPKDWSVPTDAKYLHITSNNTIYGTQFHPMPNIDTPMICDMSSDIFSRPIDPSKYAMIYAGAQKNMGPAGTTLVIVRKDVLGQVEREIPTMLDYRTHIAKGSSFNTPPVYPIYVSMLTLRWVKAQGGVAKMEQINKDKAQLLYDEIDRNSLFEGVAATEDRSLMNVTFVLKDKALEAEFTKDCEAAGCSGFKGHRSVGGFRASIYNAMPKSSVQVLVDVMKKFEEKHK